MEREAFAALPVVKQMQADARTQIMRYRDRLAETYGERLKLRCFSVVALGYERLVWEEV